MSESPVKFLELRDDEDKLIGLIEEEIELNDDNHLLSDKCRMGEIIRFLRTKISEAKEEGYREGLKNA